MSDMVAGLELVGAVERKMSLGVVRLKGRCRPDELAEQIREAWRRAGLPANDKPRS